MESRVFELIKIDRNAKFNYSLSSAAKMKKSNKNIQIFKSITFCYGKSHLTQVSINSIVCLLLISSFAQAQQELSTINYSKKFINQIELLAGPSMIYPGGNEYIKKDRIPKIGFTGGIGASHSFGSKFMITLNFLYEVKGSKVEFEYPNTDFNPPETEKAVIDNSLKYVTISTLTRYSIDGKKFFIGLGPYLSYLVSLKRESEIYRNGELIAQSTSRPDPYINYSKYDAGATGLVGFKFFIKRIESSISLWYNLGLIEIQPQLNNQSISKGIKNNTLALLYIIYLKGNKKNQISKL